MTTIYIITIIIIINSIIYIIKGGINYKIIGGIININIIINSIVKYEIIKGIEIIINNNVSIEEEVRMIIKIIIVNIYYIIGII